MKFYWQLFTASAEQWNRHNAPRLGAALAYYTILSLAPLLVLVVAIAGFAFGEQAARGEIVWQIQDLVGKQGAEAIQTMIQNAHKPSTGIVATVVGVLTLLVGASGVFAELRDSLNYIWGAKPPEGSGFMNAVKYRFFSFAMVFGIGFLLLVSLALSALIAGLGSFLEKFFSAPAPVLFVINALLSLAVIAVLFGLIFKVVPDVPIRWGDVWIGAAFTSVLFTAGKVLIGIYLGKAGVGSTYGAAGSLIILLVWVYYSAQIFFFGAEFTHVYAERAGSRMSEKTAADARPAPAAPKGLAPNRS